MLEDLGSYLPEHVRPFTDLLKQFPQNYEKWVHATGLPKELYQGDIVESAVHIAIDEEGQIIRADLPAMVISCSCDVQPEQGKFALIAPVIDLESYRDHSTELQGDALENHIRNLVANKIANLFFVPAGQKLKDSVIDFQQVTAVSVDFLSKKLDDRLTSLSQAGHYLLLIKLAHHLTRPDAVDAKRN